MAKEDAALAKREELCSQAMDVLNRTYSFPVASRENCGFLLLLADLDNRHVAKAGGNTSQQTLEAPIRDNFTFHLATIEALVVNAESTEEDIFNYDVYTGW